MGRLTWENVFGQQLTILLKNRFIGRSEPNLPLPVQRSSFSRYLPRENNLPRNRTFTTNLTCIRLDTITATMITTNMKKVYSELRKKTHPWSRKLYFEPVILNWLSL